MMMMMMMVMLTAAAQTQTCTCSCSKNSRVSASEIDDGAAPDGDDVDADQLSCRCCSALDDVAVDDNDDDDDLWAQPELERAPVRVDDGSYLRPLVTRVYPADRSDVLNRGGALPDGELTHMSWSEVLKEAQTMGIPLHLRTASASTERQRHPSCSASSTVTSASATPIRRLPDKEVQRRRTAKSVTEAGGGGKKTPTSLSSSIIKTSFRDLFRLPQLFGGRKKGAVENSGRVKRSRSMEPQHRIVPASRNPPVPLNHRSNQPHHHHRDRSADGADRTRHWVSRTSRYSAPSCPPTSATLTGSTRCRRSTSGGVSVASSSSRHAVDYCPGSSWAASSCSGSLPAYRHRCMDEMVVAVDDVCVSPSMSSFTSSVCSAHRTAPRRNRQLGAPTTPNSLASSSLASPGRSHTSSIVVDRFLPVCIFFPSFLIQFSHIPKF